MTKKTNENENDVPEVVEGEAVVEEAEDTTAEGASVKDTARDTINEAIKQVENLGKALGSALQGRANVVMVRVNDESLDYLDMLVEADITKSRSESAAFLINEGIKANEPLFGQIREITDQIVALKAKLRESVQVEE
jgi:hypothetical protein